MGNICEGPSWVITWLNIWVICGKYLDNMFEIFAGPNIVYELVWVFLLGVSIQVSVSGSCRVEVGVFD